MTAFAFLLLDIIFFLHFTGGPYMTGPTKLVYDTLSINILYNYTNNLKNNRHKKV